jgi:hypothetical protein
MQITFEIDGRIAEFTRSSTTGAAELHVGDDVVQLQHSTRLSTHFSFHKKQVWRCEVEHHTVEIAKVRPRWVGGLRDSAFTVSVDDQVVAEALG